MPIKLALVEDHPEMRKNFEKIFEIFEEVELLFTASNGADFLTKAQSQSSVPDLILMDIEMPIMNGIEATREYRRVRADAKVLMLTISDQDVHIRQALQAGAMGYVTKDEPAKILIRSIVEAYEGRFPLSPAIAGKTRRMLESDREEDQLLPDHYGLSKRELEVLQLLFRGLNYNQIATQLVLSPLTIRSHMENLYRKLKVHNKVEAVQVAIRYQWFI